MLNLHVDLGQIIITGAIAVVGYLINFTLVGFKNQITRHEQIITTLVGDVQRLVGIYEGSNGKRWNGHERRV